MPANHLLGGRAPKSVVWSSVCAVCGTGENSLILNNVARSIVWLISGVEQRYSVFSKQPIHQLMMDCGNR